MSWTTPSTWTGGQLVTAANLNEQLRDNLNYINTREAEYGFTYPFYNNGSVLTAGTPYAIKMNTSGTITAIELFSGTVKGNGTIDVYKFSSSQAGTVVYGTALSIFGGGAKPSLAGTNYAVGSGYAYTFTSSDWLVPVLNNCGTITQLAVAFTVTKP